VKPHHHAHLGSVQAVLGVAAAMALAAGIAGCSGSQQVARQAAAGSPSCDALQRQIAAGASVDVAAAESCDQSQFAVLENARQVARAKGQKPAMQISGICQAVDARAAKGDPTLDFNLAFHCRQRERFANTVNALNGAGPANKLTSLCQGAAAKKARGQSVDAFTQSFCSAEAAAAGGTKSANAPAPRRTTGGAAATGAQSGTKVVCAGSTVTLSGEAGAPGATSNQLPVGTMVRVTNLDNNKQIVVPVVGPSGSCLLLNNAAFEQVRQPGKFLIRRARIERVG
jgi:hypothetical protein